GESACATAPLAVAMVPPRAALTGSPVRWAVVYTNDKLRDTPASEYVGAFESGATTRKDLHIDVAQWCAAQDGVDFGQVKQDDFAQNSLHIAHAGGLIGEADGQDGIAQLRAGPPEC